MKIKPISLIVVLVAIGIAFSLGYMSGFIKGFQNAFWFDAPGKALVDIVDLRQLRKGDINQVIDSKEDDLDKQIYLHGEYLKKGNPQMTQFYFTYFSDPRWPTAIKDTQILMYDAARYRSQYPIHISAPCFTREADKAFKKEMKSRFDNEVETIKKTLLLYGWKVTP
jgi:hypothetical protein